MADDDEKDERPQPPFGAPPSYQPPKPPDIRPPDIRPPDIRPPDIRPPHFEPPPSAPPPAPLYGGATDQSQPPQEGAPPPSPYNAPPPQYPPPSPYGGPPPGQYPAPPPIGGYQPGYAPQQQFKVRKTNGLAIASLVLGILWIYWLGSILALIFGYIGKNQIDNADGGQDGRGLAVAGIVLGWIGIATLVVVIIVAVAAG